MGAFEKGSSLKSSFQAVQAVLGDEQWQQVVDALDPQDRDVVLAPEKVHLVPTALTGRFYSALHRVAGSGDRQRTAYLLRMAGRRDADDMLDGVFSVFARFISPDQAFSRAGGMISSIYSGVTAQTTKNEGRPGGTLSLTGLDDEPFAACVIGGWIERAIERFGARNPTVIERNWAAGRDAAETLIFELSWED